MAQETCTILKKVWGVIPVPAYIPVNNAITAINVKKAKIMPIAVSVSVNSTE